MGLAGLASGWVWRSLRRLLGVTWPAFGLSWAALGLSWALLGHILGASGAISGLPCPVWGRFSLPNASPTSISFQVLSKIVKSPQKHHPLPFGNFQSTSGNQGKRIKPVLRPPGHCGHRFGDYMDLMAISLLRPLGIPGIPGGVPRDPRDGYSGIPWVGTHGIPWVGTMGSQGGPLGPMGPWDPLALGAHGPLGPACLVARAQAAGTVFFNTEKPRKHPAGNT